MRRTRLYRSIIVVGTTLAGGAIVGSATSGCDLYYEPSPPIEPIHVDSWFTMIDAPMIDASIVDAWNPIADAPNDTGRGDAR
jgi:hypothetical protein